MQIITHFEGAQADLVVCDGAPDGQLSIIFGFLKLELVLS